MKSENRDGEGLEERARRAGEEEQTANWWKPAQPGDKVTGVVVRIFAFKQMDFDGKTERNRTGIRIRQEDESVITVSFGDGKLANLTRQMEDLNPPLAMRDRICIVYLGEGKKKKGNPPKIFGLARDPEKSSAESDDIRF